MMNKIKVNFNGKEIERKVMIDKKGDQYIQHHSEKWLLHPRTNEIMHPVTSNLTSALWERQNYIDARMHHLDKLPVPTASLVASSLNTLNNWYQKEKDFLDTHYEQDSYALNQWINYAFDTIKKN